MRGPKLVAELANSKHVYFIKVILNWCDCVAVYIAEQGQSDENLGGDEVLN